MQLSRSIFRHAAGAFKNASPNCRNVATAAVWKPRSVSVLRPPATELTKLNNGIRVASENHGGSLCTVGVWMNIGSRDEREDQSGASHFIEHLFFEGTNKKGKQELHKELSKITKYVDSYAGKEHSALFATCLAQDLDQMVALLSEMLLSPSFEPENVEKARAKVLARLDEIADDSSELLFNYAHFQAYQGTPLIMPHYGRRQNCLSMSADDVSIFHQNYFKSSRMVVAGVGDIEHDHLVELSDKYFGGVDSTPVDKTIPRTSCRFIGGHLDHRDDSWPYTYAFLSVEGPGWEQRSDMVAMQVASKMMGNWCSWKEPYQTSSYRLPQRLGWDNHMLMYESVYTPYYNTGLWGVHYISEQMNAEVCAKLIMKEWKYIATLSDERDVAVGRNYLLRDLYASDSCREVCDQLGRDILRYNQRYLTPQIAATIMNIDAATLKSTCYRYLYDRELSIASFGKTAELTFFRYPFLKAYTWWLLS